jgi:hypothetical protein
MLRLMVMRTVAGALLVLALTGCGSDGAVTASDATSAEADARVTTAVSADETCQVAAQQWGGTPAASHSMTVAEVRAFMEDPHGASKDPTAPRPGPYQYPAGWDGLPEDTPAAACYLDGPVPKGPPPAMDGTVQPSFDRRLVIATEGAASFMVSAGYRDNMPAEPLTRSGG